MVSGGHQVRDRLVLISGPFQRWQDAALGAAICRAPESFSSAAPSKLRSRLSRSTALAAGEHVIHDSSLSGFPVATAGRHMPFKEEPWTSRSLPPSN